MNINHHIAILDDHSVYLKGLKVLIGGFLSNSTIELFSSVAEFKTGFTNIATLDLFITDIELPEENIFTLLNEVKKERPELPVLVISMHKKLSVIRRCKNLKIEGYLLKDDDNLLEKSVTALLGGDKFYSPRVEKFYNSLNNNINRISVREEEVIRMICNGYSNQSIAEELNISIETVKSHKKNIKSKLGFSENSELIKFAREQLFI